MDCYISEFQGVVGGVLLENSLQLPIAFINTETALGSKASGRPSVANRYVSIARAGSALASGGQAGYDAPFAVVYADQGAGFHYLMYHCTPSGEKGPLILHIYQTQSRDRLFNIADPGGALIGTCEERNESGLWRSSKCTR